MRKRKLLSLVMAMAMVLSLLPITVWAVNENWSDHADISWYADNADNFTISDAADLAGLAALVNSGKNFSGKTVNLDADINLSGYNWTPIGTSSTNSFKGTFNGNNHVISNLSAINDLSYGNGFFGNIVGSIASVKNLTFENAYVSRYAPSSSSVSGNVYGIVSAYAYGTVTFENVHVKNSAIRGYGKIGPILGMAAQPGNTTTTLKNCTVENTTVTAVYNAGGLIGLAQNLVVLDGCSTTNVTPNLLDTQNQVDLNTTATDDAKSKTLDVVGKYWVYSDTSYVYYYATWGDFYTDYYYAARDDFYVLAGYPQNHLLAHGLCHNAVAEVNGTKYATLPKAIEAAGVGDTVDLLGNIEVDSKILINKKLTLDGNGYEVKAADNFYIDTSSSAAQNSTKQLLGIEGEAAKGATVQNITLDSNNVAYGFQPYNVKGVVSLNNVTLKNSKGTGMTVNGSSVVADQLTISGSGWGQSIDVSNGVGINGSPMLTLTNSSLQDSIGIFEDIGNNVEPNGATVTVDSNVYQPVKNETAGKWIYLADGKMPVMIGETGYWTLAEAVAHAQNNDTVTLLADVTLTEPLTIDKNMTLDLGSKILTLNTPTTSDAITIHSQSATTESPINVMIENGTITDIRGLNNAAYGKNTVFVKDAANLTTRNVTIQAYAPNSLTSPYYNYLLRISPTAKTGGDAKYGTLTLESGTRLVELSTPTEDTYGVVGVTATGAYGNGNEVPENYAGTKVIIKDGVSIETTGYALTGNGSAHGTTFVIEGGSLISKGSTGIYHPQAGVMTITGNPTITGANAGIEIRSGSLDIAGGTLRSTATEFTCDPNSNGTTTSGAALAIAQHTTKKDISVTISGGTFAGIKALNESNPQANDPAPQVSLSVTGGNFTGDVTITDAPTSGFITGGTFSSDPSAYTSTGSIVKRDGTSAYTYTVLPKSGLTSGIYLSDPTGFTASNYYVTNNNDGTWTVYYSAPSGGSSSSSGDKTETVTNPDGSTTTTVTKPDGTVT